MKVFNQQDLSTINKIIMSNLQQFCGIDVSSTTLDFIVLSTEDSTRISAKAIKSKSKEFIQIPNTLAAIESNFSQAEFDQTLFVLEATGTYSSKLLHQLSQMNRQVSVVSPYQSKSYMASKGITNKNDKNAAFCLAAMGKNEELRLYKAPSMEIQQRKQIFSTFQALQKQERTLSNQIHALEQYPQVNQLALNSLQQVLNQVIEQRKMLEKQLYSISQDPNFKEKMKYGSSVIGIGKKTAEAILLATNGLQGFEQAPAVAKCLGITPHSHYSGTSINRRGGITKFGSNSVRGLLYMCTRSAIQHNKACKELYTRLRTKGKPHKVAAVAVMHKLVKQFFACVKFNRIFDNDYHIKEKQVKK